MPAATAPDDFAQFIRSKSFPCVGAKSALALGQIETIEAGPIACPRDDQSIHDALLDFGERLDPTSNGVATFACLFADAGPMTERQFEQAMWARLQSLHDIDASTGVDWAAGVSRDTASPKFSMSIGGMAWFVVGLHPGASRPARRFHRPAMVFNAHAQFERLRADGRYGKMQEIIRARELETVGGVNPMLTDFGDRAEASQYSGRRVSAEWRCPLKVRV